MKSDGSGPRKDTLHLPLDGDPSYVPGRRHFIGSRKDTPHRPLDLSIFPRKDTLHRASKGHPSSATEKKPCIAPPSMHSFIEDGINLDTNLVCES